MLRCHIATQFTKKNTKKKGIPNQLKSQFYVSRSDGGLRKQTENQQQAILSITILINEQDLFNGEQTRYDGERVTLIVVHAICRMSISTFLYDYKEIGSFRRDDI